MIKIPLLACAMGLILACASQPPRSLLDARSAYQRAAQGPAAQANPAQLHVARTSLLLAEKTYDDEGDSPNARDRAYVAQRKAELAEVQASIAEDERRAEMAKRKAELNRAQIQLAMQQSLTQTQAQLAAEQQRRQEAERRTAEAMAKLSSIASVKKETRGMVITLSGAVIFASNKADLLPAARTKLDQVASALKQSEPGSKFLVEGHTDSRGADETNQELSTRRAAAVRDYLVQQGVPADRITSVGRGESQPIADNDTAEGRANNRRVEIIVQSEPGAQNESQQQGNAGAQSGAAGPSSAPAGNSTQLGASSATGSTSRQNTQGASTSSTWRATTGSGTSPSTATGGTQPPGTSTRPGATQQRQPSATSGTQRPGTPTQPGASK